MRENDSQIIETYQAKLPVEQSTSLDPVGKMELKVEL
jgi:hypothetical protein